MEGVLADTCTAVPLEIGIGTAGGYTLKATSRVESVREIYGGDKAATSGRVLHVPELKHVFVSASNVSDENHHVHGVPKNSKFVTLSPPVLKESNMYFSNH